jgi:hypothetical protein
MGGGKKSKAPPAPNYTAIAAQDAAAQKETAELITQQNRPTQKDALGNSINWTKDASGNWTQTENWDPRVTQGYDQAFKLRGDAMVDLAGGEFQDPGKVKDYQNNAGPVAQFDPTTGKAASDAMYASYMSRAGKEQGDQQAQMQTQLRQQGLQPGTEAYDRAYKNLLTAQGDVNSKANLDSIVLGGNEARQNYQSILAGQSQKYNQGVTDYQTKMAGQDQNYKQADANYSRLWDTAGAANNMLNSQYRPTYQGFSGATGYNPADMLGASQAAYNAKMGGYNTQQGKKGSTMNAGMGMMGSIFG